MENPSTFKIWIAQTRANFLLLAVFLSLIGLALATDYQGIPAIKINILDAVLVFIGVILSHASVNLFNEYSDFNTKIDFNTFRNPFSGGSGMLTSGLTTPKKVLTAAIATLVIGLLIGTYFAIKANWIILLIMALGAISVVFYTNFLAKHLLGEFFAGLTLGSLVVIGTYIALVGQQHTSWAEFFSLKLILISIPPGILTFQLLFLNEFPDMDADKQGGRNHLVIKLGKKNAAILYNILMAITFGTIIITPLLHVASFWVYLALLPLPLVIKAGTGSMKHYNSIENIVPVMGINVIIVLATDLLLAVGIFI